MELARVALLILETELNSKNWTTRIYMLAFPVTISSFNIMDWNLSELKRLDIKVRKMMTIHIR